MKNGESESDVRFVFYFSSVVYEVDTILSHNNPF